MEAGRRGQAGSDCQGDSWQTGHGQLCPLPVLSSGPEGLGTGAARTLTASVARGQPPGLLSRTREKQGSEEWLPAGLLF